MGDSHNTLSDLEREDEADTEKNYKVKKRHLDDLGLKQVKRYKRAHEGGDSP